MEAPAYDGQAVAEEREVMVMSTQVVSAPTSDSDYRDPSIEPLIIRTGSLDIVVNNTEAAIDAIEALVKDLGGYVVESSLYKYQEGFRGNISVRVPAGRFDDAMENLRDLATDVRHESTSGQNVTEEYVDLQSSLRHLQQTEAKLQQFLEDAEDTEAALAVFQQMRSVQAEIEQITGRMKYLEQSAAMSSINVSLTPDALAQPIEIGGWRPQGTLRDAFQSLIRVMQFLVDALIIIVVLILPVLIVIAIPIVIIVLIIRAIVRRRRARKARAAQARVETQQQ